MPNGVTSWDRVAKRTNTMQCVEEDNGDVPLLTKSAGSEDDDDSDVLEVHAVPPAEVDGAGATTTPRKRRQSQESDEEFSKVTRNLERQPPALISLLRSTSHLHPSPNTTSGPSPSTSSRRRRTQSEKLDLAKLNAAGAAALLLASKGTGEEVPLNFHNTSSVLRQYKEERVSQERGRTQSPSFLRSNTLGHAPGVAVGAPLGKGNGSNSRVAPSGPRRKRIHSAIVQRQEGGGLELRLEPGSGDEVEKEMWGAGTASSSSTTSSDSSPELSPDVTPVEKVKNARRAFTRQLSEDIDKVIWHELEFEGQR